MKKTFLTIALCSLIALSGCSTKKESTPKVPKSVSIYQQLNLTAEQQKKVSDIRANQRTKMEAIRKEMEESRKQLLSTDESKKITPEERKANLEKYREVSIKTREKINATRAEYDKSFAAILDEKQQKTYDKYLKQREKEKAEREAEINKNIKK